MDAHEEADKTKGRRGLSLATITIITFIIIISIIIALALWMGGSTGQFTKFEQIEIQSTGCSKSQGNWTISIKLKNSGSRDSKLVSLYINEEEVDEYGQSSSGYVFHDNWATNMTQEETIKSGETVCIFIYIDPDTPGSSLTSRTMINIKIHSSSGTDYLKTIELV